MANNPSQGLNLGGQPGAYGDTFSAIDLFKGADAWITQDEGGNELRGAVKTDAKGWATELPLLDGAPQAIWANIFYTKIVPPGDYIVEWNGEGTIFPYNGYEQIAPNKIRVKYDADYSGADGQSGISLRIEATDPNNTGNYIRDIKVYQEKHADLMAMGERFDPEWFQQIDDFRVLRTHDWQGTNFSTVTDWTRNDATADQAFWVNDGRGMPYELLVGTANQTRSDLWINIPHMATDDYMRKAAEYVKAHLDKDLRVYVEYTNEYWTDIFDQHPYLVAKGAELFGDAPFANAQAYGARASEMTQIFKEVFGGDGARLYPTVTLNHGAFNTQEAITMLTSPAYVAKGGVSPLDAGIRFLGTDGYFTWFNTDPATDARTDAWIAEPDKGYGSARDFLIEQIMTELSPAWAKGKALSDQYGLAFGVYEGGALLLNGSYEAPGAPRFTQFNEDVQLSAEMKEVYEVALAEWRKTGNGPFAWYSDTGRWGPWGDYGLWNAPDFTPEPRAEAIIDANQTIEPWFTGDTRPASTFDNGKYDAGTAAAETMAGTNLADRLYGLAGNDTMTGLDGADRLVGGLGKDSLSGGNGRDRLIGGADADTLDGGAEFDFASYQTSAAPVTADLLKRIGIAGDAKGDALKDIDGFIGGSGSDTFRGDLGVNVIDGQAGNDRMSGLDGNDRLKGGLGDDRILGGAGDDRLSGGAGNDTFYMGPGKDTVTDWREGDHVAVSAAGWAYADPANVKIAQTGADTTLTHAASAGTWSMVLLNTKSSTVTVADDFLFA